MKELVKCKSCGYIMEKGKLKDKCPACGVPAAMFEPYAEKISSPRRKFILSLDIHPVIVHFPQAFTVTILVLSIIAALIKGGVQASLLTTVGVLSCCLPLVVLGAFLAGLMDGKIRFRRVTTPILVKKIILAGLFFLLSIAILLLNIFYKLDNPAVLYAVIILSAGCLVCGSILAKYGVSLLEAKFPG